MTLLRHWRRTLLRGVGAVVASQVAALIGISIYESVQRPRRKVRNFPVTPATPATVGEHDVTLYTFGEHLYADMLDAIANATDHIYLESYIWKNDEVGERFKQALIHASKRGVDVYLVWDSFANAVVPRSFFDFPPEIHCRVHPMVSSSRFLNARNWGRNHHKLLTVDSRVGFIGGYNIGELYANRWRDTHARVQGPVVAELENAFIDYWNSSPITLIPRRRKQPPLPPQPSRRWPGAIRVHRNVPRWALFPIRSMYLEAIDRASQQIWLTVAYLVPDEDLIEALVAAVARGVDVRIIVPQQSNHVVADWLSRGFYTELLRGGVRLFLYEGAMVHAKTGTIDHLWSTVGTANLDRLSLAGNYELNVEIISSEVAANMEDIFLLDQGNSYELTLAEWQTRSRTAKFTEALISPLRPLV